MNASHIVAILRRLEKEAGSQTAAASRLRISNTYFNEVVRGKKEPAAKLLAALGLERVVLYRRMR